MIRSLVSIVLVVAFIAFGATVPLGSRTLFGHLSRIWQAEETQELVEGVKKESGPLVDRVKKGAQAGWEAMQEGRDGGAGERGGGDARDPSPAPDNAGGEAKVEDGRSLRDRAADQAAEVVGDVAERQARDEIRSRLGQ